MRYSFRMIPRRKALRNPETEPRKIECAQLHAKPKRVAGEGIPREEEEEEEEVHKKHMSWIVCIFKSTNPVDGSYPDLLPRLRFL